MSESEPKGSKKFFDLSNTRNSLIIGCGAAVTIVSCAFMGFLLLYDYDLEEWEDVSAIVRNFFIIFGGVVGFVLAVIRLRQNDDQIRTAKLEAEGRETERVRESFQQAVAMLYGEEDETKPFSISQIRRIALDKPEQHLEQAISLLCGFARKHSSDPQDDTAGMDLSPLEEKLFELTRQSLDVVFELSAEFEKQGGGPAPINLRNIFLSDRVVAGVTLTQSSINDTAFHAVEFNDCTFTGNFRGTFGRRDRETGELLTPWSFNGVRFVNTKFDKAKFESINFQKVVFIECTSVFSSWIYCDLSRSTIFSLKIIDNMSQLIQPMINKILFADCGMARVTFRFPENEEFLNSVDHKGARHNYLESDFSRCYIPSYLTNDTSMEVYPRPTGLEKNLPELEIELRDTQGDNKRLIIIREKDCHDVVAKSDAHD